MPFAPEYVTLVLDENFEDAKAQFLAPLMAIHYAHLVMLTAQVGHLIFQRGTRWGQFGASDAEFHTAGSIDWESPSPVFPAT